MLGKSWWSCCRNTLILAIAIVTTLREQKNAFACGTMGFDDFEEFDNETVADIADHLIAHGVTVQECGHWVSYQSDEPYGCNDEKEWYRCSKCGKDAYGRCYEDEWYSAPILSAHCPHCGEKMMTQRRKEIAMSEERIEYVCGILCKVRSEKFPDGYRDVYTFKVDGWEECSVTGRRAAKRVIHGRLDPAVRNTMLKSPKGE